MLAAAWLAAAGGHWMHSVVAIETSSNGEIFSIRRVAAGRRRQPQRREADELHHYLDDQKRERELAGERGRDVLVRLASLTRVRLRDERKVCALSGPQTAGRDAANDGTGDARAECVGRIYARDKICADVGALHQ